MTPFSRKSENLGCGRLECRLLAVLQRDGRAQDEARRQRLKTVENRQKYLERLKLAVEHLHQCSARHCMSVPLHEELDGRTVWKGAVEVFDITGNPKAHVCFAWLNRTGSDDSDSDGRFVAVLGIPPVVSPVMAVRVAIAADAKHSE